MEIIAMVSFNVVINIYSFWTHLPHVRLMLGDVSESKDSPFNPVPMYLIRVKSLIRMIQSEWRNIVHVTAATDILNISKEGQHVNFMKLM